MQWAQLGVEEWGLGTRGMDEDSFRLEAQARGTEGLE
jgi:hypothetical protein